MSINSKIRKALLPLVDTVVPSEYSGEKLEYIVFTDTVVPEVPAEGRPGVLRHLLLINWYFPKGVNPLEKKRAIAEELWSAGFTYPSITELEEENGQHFAFECEGKEDGHL